MKASYYSAGTSASQHSRHHANGTGWYTDYSGTYKAAIHP